MLFNTKDNSGLGKHDDFDDDDDGDDNNNWHLLSGHCSQGVLLNCFAYISNLHLITNLQSICY